VTSSAAEPPRRAGDATVRAQSRIGFLRVGDPLRAIAALSVLLYHVALFSDPQLDDVRFTQEFGSRFGTVVGRAGGGLEVFFVLSGYLIAGPFVRAIVSGTPTPPIGRYVRNRLLRIVPAFWVVFTLTLLIAGVVGRPIVDVLAVYGFAQAVRDSATANLIGQGWTLGVEMSFYALIAVGGAAAGLLGRRGSERRRRVLVVIAVVALGVLSYEASVTGLGHRTLVATGFAFVPGIVFAALEPVVPAGIGRRRFFSLGAASIAIVAILIYLRPGHHLPGGAVFPAAALVGSALLLQRATGATWRVLDNKPLHWLGVRSYSIYLIHWGVLLALRPYLQRDGHAIASFVALLVTATPLTIALSALNYRLVERPFLRLRKAWRRAPA
jgi:peptidoglycan/LPS O-acetylase OafA/YrhL